MLFSGQGIVTIAELGAGGVGPFRDVQNAPDFTVGLKEEVKQLKEARTGTRGILSQLTTGQDVDVKVTLNDWGSENLRIAVRAGATVVTPGGAVAGSKSTGTAVVAGDVFELNQLNIKTAIVKDSTAGTPKALVEGVDYELDAGFGNIKFLRIANDGAVPYVQPFVINGVTYGGSEQVAMFTAAKKNYVVRLNGVNTADGNKKVLVELYKVQFSPATQLALISDDYGKFDLTGTVQIDTSKPASGDLGQYGRIIHLS